MIIKSKYYELKEVHEFNKFIKSLSIDELRSSAFQNIEYLLVNCLSFNKSYKDISKFVPNSPTWLEITEQNKKYDDAQKTLKEYKHTKEMVLEECYPESLNIWKHTYSTNLNFYEDSHEETYEETFHFYTVGTFSEHILIVDNNRKIQPEQKQIKWGSLYLDYINREWSEHKDLIDEACNSIEYQSKIINVYDLAERLTKQYGERITQYDLWNIFWIQDAVYFTNFIRYKGKEYYEIDIFTLIKEYWKYKDKKYIKGDEYVDYPFDKYLDFKEKLNSGEYILVEEISPEEDLPF